MISLVIFSYNTMIPQYSETLATKEVLSLDWIPLLLAQCLHSNALRLQGLEAFRCDCEAMSILEDSVHARPHFFKATVALSAELCDGRAFARRQVLQWEKRGGVRCRTAERPRDPDDVDVLPDGTHAS